MVNFNLLNQVNQLIHNTFIPSYKKPTEIKKSICWWGDGVYNCLT